MAVLKFNQEDNSDRTTFFGIPLTAAINVHGAFPKSERFVAGLALGNAPYGDSDHTKRQDQQSHSSSPKSDRQ
jgi:hypothetical protein